MDERVPEDVWLLILKRLSKRDLIAVGSSCRRLHQFTGTNMLWGGSRDALAGSAKIAALRLPVHPSRFVEDHNMAFVVGPEPEWFGGLNKHRQTSTTTHRQRVQERKMCSSRRVPFRHRCDRHSGKNAGVRRPSCHL